MTTETTIHPMQQLVKAIERPGLYAYGIEEYLVVKYAPNYAGWKGPENSRRIAEVAGPEGFYAEAEAYHDTRPALFWVVGYRENGYVSRGHADLESALGDILEIHARESAS